jgi:branched-chain amino acid transport system substrate-binding protein
MKFRRRWCVLAVLVVLVAAPLLAACGGGGSTSSASASPQGVFKIGYSADLSDGWSSYDVPMRDGAQFAVDEINAAGGVAGKKLELIVRDNKADQALAVQTTQELIDQGIEYLIGTTSNNVAACGRLVAAKQIPCDTGDNTAPNWVDQIGPFAFQYVMSDNLQAAAMANYCYTDLGYKTAYLLRSQDNPYTANLPTYFADAFQRLGGKIVGTAEYKLEAGDFAAQITKISNASPKPDVIYTPMYLPDSAIFFKQLRAAGITIPVATSDGNDTPDLLAAGKKALDGIILTSFGYPKPGSSLEAFYKKYEAATGATAETIIIANGYDTVYVLKAALEKSGGEGGVALRDAISTLSGVKLSTTDNFVMDPKTRRAEREVALLKIVDGKFTLVKYLPYPAYVPAPIQ